ncbi:hypothetical protein FGU65_07405 [Methanoculleus sp. FWC-SCC1]|uniref:Uncharacterized protein n=1 Tax=Methanoculleus frigidifontis TaxID=2584085 RepID=A0ABT8M9U9_9EURY|nr:hypothetical protein [Methanoculleus sp. FWC-SCC1]MDN7024713.1 hypothetical protein [Methanoculleus sp. FWC-SCC1]
MTAGSRPAAGVTIGLVVSLLLMLLLAASGCTVPQVQPPPAPTPEFRSESVGYDDRVVFRFIPDTSQPATYFVTYDITRNGNTVTSEVQAVYEGVVRSGPIEFTVERGPGDAVEIAITVVNADGVEVHMSRIAVRSGVGAENFTVESTREMRRD